MPKTNRRGEPRTSELPGTLRRSPRKAQETFAKAHDSALAEYGDEERAHRVAYSALKHSFQKVGDHWEEKARPVADDQGRACGRHSPQAGLSRYAPSIASVSGDLTWKTRRSTVCAAR